MRETLELEISKESNVHWAKRNPIFTDTLMRSEIAIALGKRSCDCEGQLNKSEWQY